MNIEELKNSHAKLKQWLAVILDQVDYTSGACGLTEMVGACLPVDVIRQARKALEEARL